INNSLDAGSTSIAIRIHIQESTIQVIDNGHGITKTDFHLIGQRYVTSKIMDVATLKAAPQNYGYRGEFLANIIAVSQIAKVTSRHESSEDTWAKIFSHGKEKKFTKMTTRPTKGTTVDIKGFLYNLNIQKRGIDPVSELQNIKMFLEQLSLVHNHISISLRDDSQNEILFQIHKKRDIYQTLTSLFNIEKSDVQELQVEKNQYKEKLINKLTCTTSMSMESLYIIVARLHKITNEYFKKCLNIKEQVRLKSKRHIDENQLFNQNIPFYIIFIICPYIDYDINYTTKQSNIEFKNWDQMSNMLEKTVKFFVGDVNLKEIKKIENKVTNVHKINDKENNNTRDQVKKIIDKILGNNSKKLGVSQLHNGVKENQVNDKNTDIIQDLELLEKSQRKPTNGDDKIRDISDVNIVDNINSIYNNFVNDVQVNAEIYEPFIQNVEELATKNINKFQTKVKKDHASLVFDENSLKTATVLGQVDCKFIAAVMEDRGVQPIEASQYLILFDQHAVHERIRLENNLADYITDDKWNSVSVDNMILKLSKDEILYLHNHKDKFNQLGLFWTITDNNEVIVHSIPEAILGKNPREVDKVIKAVRNLIVEEISVINLQKGCMSLYPKSIMDLVFSEACRYAIKFGDQLSKSDCVELLNGLSSCKTPFQCAHGRPVMAVIMDIKADKREYKVNMKQLKLFKERN
ncbi:hypothetical protein HW555_004643, partial [Spodoptera exigua]